MKLSWVTLRVGDLEKSVAFYTETLGMEEASRFGGGEHRIVMLGKADDAKLELICTSEAPPQSPGAGVSFGLETGDLDALTVRLKQSGFAVEGPVSPEPGIRFFFVKDPDGYTVQLLE